jgi:hypothetical protein
MQSRSQFDVLNPRDLQQGKMPNASEMPNGQKCGVRLLGRMTI